MKRNGKLLGDLIGKLSTKDNKIKMAVGSELVKHLSDCEFSLDSEDFAILIHEMVVWLRSSSRIVVECAIDILILVIDRLPSYFKQYVHLVFGAVTDRLGDNKATVRQKAKLFILKLIESDVTTSQNAIDRLTTSFTHKNSKIREEVLNCIQIIYSELIDKQLLSRHLDSIIRLLNDPALNVRDAAINTVTVLYRSFGEKLRYDLQSKYDINPEKLQILLSKFEEVKPVGAQTSREFKVTERKPHSGKSIVNCVATCEKVSKASNTLSRPTTAPSELTSVIDEQDVLKSFENIPKVNIGTLHDLETVLGTIKTVIQDSNEEWSKRVEHLKKLRALVKAGWGNQEEFVSTIRYMVSSFDIAVRDLRSQVVRETCYTICYLVQELGLKLDHFSEIILVSLIALIQNSVKVIASAALITIIFILKNVMHGKLIAIILGSLNSKSKEIRRACYDFIDFILTYWSTVDVERHVEQFQEAIKKGIADADSAARSSARKAFRIFENRFPVNAAHLIDTLDPSRRKILMEVPISVPVKYTRQKRNRISYSEDGESSDQEKTQYRSYPYVRASSSALFPHYRLKSVEEQIYSFSSTVENQLSLSRPGTPLRRIIDVHRRSASFPGVGMHWPRRKISTHRTTYDEDKRFLFIKTEDAFEYQYGVTNFGVESSTNSSLLMNDIPMTDASVKENEEGNMTDFECKSLLLGELNDANSNPQNADNASPNNHEPECYEGSNSFSSTSNFINKCKSSNWFVRKLGLQALQNYLVKGNRLNPHDVQQAADAFCKIFTDENTKSLNTALDAFNELILTHYDDLGNWLFDFLKNLFNKLNTDILATVRDKIQRSLSIVSRSFQPALQYVSIFQYISSLKQIPDSKCQVAIIGHLTDISSRVDFPNLSIDTSLITAVLEKMIVWYHCAKSRKVMEMSGVALKAILEINLPHINFILSSLPLEYRETVFMFLSEQNSSNRSKSLRRSPTTPHSCPQFISSSEGSKLIKRQERNGSKREISHLINQANDVTHTSPRFRRFYSDNNINKKVSSINLKRCSDQRQHLLNAIETLKVNNKGYLKNSIHECKTSVSFIKALVNSNHCCIIADEFKLVLKALLCLLSSKDNGVRIDVLGVFSAMFNNTYLLPYFANYTELMVLRVLNAYVDTDKKVVIAADSCATAMGANSSADLLISVLCPLIRMGNFPMNYSATKMLTKVVQSNSRAIIRRYLPEIMRSLLEEYDDEELSVRKAAVVCIVATNAVVGNQMLQPYLSTLRESKLKLLNFYIDNNESIL